MPSRTHLFLTIAAALLLMLAFVRQNGSMRSSLQNAWPSAAQSSATPCRISPELDPLDPASNSPTVTIASNTQERYTRVPSFQEIALKYGSDKVTAHRYWYMYKKYLEPIRQQPLKFLEIGLGCDMNYGPGRSYYSWKEYLPYADIYYIEYDAHCAEKWREKTGVNIYIGDQANVTFLDEFIADTGGDFDVIVDDGGHSMIQQINSLSTLWKAVKPGGYYFCEDLHTSFHPKWEGDPDSTEGNPAIHTMIKFVYRLIDDIMIDGEREHELSSSMRSIDCMREVCAFIKKDELEA